MEKIAKTTTTDSQQETHLRTPREWSKAARTEATTRTAGERSAWSSTRPPQEQALSEESKASTTQQTSTAASRPQGTATAGREERTL